MHRGEQCSSGASLSDYATEYQAVQDLSDDEFRGLFGTRVLVAGSRGFNSYESFCDSLEGSIDLKLMREDGCFISGCAKRGADAMIIRWCKENEILCREYPADWDALGKSAGYVRNAQMAEVANEAVIFWDALSKGTKNMIDLCVRKSIKHTIFLYDSDETLPTNVSEANKARRDLNYRSASQALLEWSPETD